MKFGIRSTATFLIIASGALCGFTPDASAGCRINYSMGNNSITDVVIIEQFQVKSKGGAWKKVPKVKSKVKDNSTFRRSKAYKRHLRNMKRSRKKLTKGIFVELVPGEKVDSYFNASFGCKAKRQYRFVVHEGQCSKSIYYPSTSGWTPKNNTSVNFGDISRHCR